VSVVVTLSDSGPSKGELADMALEECGLAGFEFQRTPEEIASAIRELDTMMYEWPWSLLGFAHADFGTGSPADLSGIPFAAKAVTVKHLALRLAPKMMGTLSPESRASLARSMALLQAEYATVPTAKLMSTPAGAGNRGRATFIQEV
jgi:hypothetical protein